MGEQRQTQSKRYRISDFRFGQMALTLRERAGLTQVEVATALGVSRRAIQHWEGGTAFPAGDNLQSLIALFLQHGAFATGHEREQAQALWAQAEESASRRKAIFDELWFADVLAHNPQKGDTGYRHAAPHHAVQQRVDWDDAPDVPALYGRERELETLAHWVNDDGCRVIGLLGIGGIGKTTLAIRFAQAALPQFERVVWRTLRDGPHLSDLLVGCLRVLDDEVDATRRASDATNGAASSATNGESPLLHQPATVEQLITQLMQVLRSRRCLLIFDNAETLLESGNVAGCYRPGYEDYGTLFQRAAETAHQSCLIFTSREMLCDLEPLQGAQSPVRGLKLPGLAPSASQALLHDKGVFGPPNAWDAFALHYSGNPLALKIASATVRDVFGGDLAAYLREAPVTLHTLKQLLADQFERLSQLERDVLVWLTIEREWVGLEVLKANLASTLTADDLLAALMALRRRSLVERGESSAVFTLQPVVMEFVTQWLVTQMSEEITRGEMRLLMRYALLKSESADYIRNSQSRMVLKPVLARVLDRAGGQTQLEQHLRVLVQRLRTRPHTDQGYAGGNIINLLIELRGHVRGWDFSHLSLRQAYIQEAEAQDARFEDTNLGGVRFLEPLEAISAMTLSVDGQFLAVSSFSGQIRVWQVSDGGLKWVAQGHASLVWSLAFTADNGLLASGDHQGKIRLWDVPSGELRQTLQGRRTWLSAITISPDGRTIVCAGDDAMICVWDIVSERCVHTLAGHRGRVMSTAFSPRGDVFITGGSDGDVRVWDAATGACLRILNHGSGPIKVAFRVDGTCIASCGEEDGLIKLWDVRAGIIFCTLQRPKTGPASIAFNPEGSLLASGDHVGALNVWDLRHDPQTVHHIGTIQAHRTFVGAVSFAPNGLLASASYGGHVRLWESRSGKLLKTFQGYSRLITVMAFSPDGKLLVQGDKSGQVRVWALLSGQCLSTVQAHDGPVWALAVAPDGRTFTGHTGVVWTLAFSPDGEWLASGSGDKDIRLWCTGPDSRTRAKGHVVLHGATDWVWSLAFSGDDKSLASGHSNGEVRVWDLRSQECHTVLRNQTPTIGALQFSADGRTLITSSDREALAWWDLASETCRSIPETLSASNCNNAIALSRDGALLACACTDQSVQLWRVGRPGKARQIARLTGHSGHVWAVAVSHDHRLTASSDDTGTTLVWDTRTQVILHRLSLDRPYERMHIHGAIGLNEAQRASLVALGALQ